MKNLGKTSFLYHYNLMFFIFIFNSGFAQKEAIKDKRVIEAEIKILNKKISSS